MVFKKLRLLVFVLLIAALSIAFSALFLVKAQPSPVQSLKVASGVISYYSSMQTSTPPGLIIRVYAINGSSTYPIPAFVAVYGLTPRHIVPIAYGLGPVVNVPFNNTNWLFVANKWLTFNPGINEYNTSLLVFVTYIDFTENKSWIEAYSVPYNVGWVIHDPGKIKYIVLTAYVNLSSRPFRVVPVRQLPLSQPVINSSSKDPVYTEYNCYEQSPTAPQLSNGPYIYEPTLYCYGFTGPIPLAWVTWSQGITNEYEQYDLDLELYVDYSGTFTWDAIGYARGGFFTIGTSYQANVDWNNDSDLGFGSYAFLAQPGSYYFAYDGSFALANYTEYYYTIHTGYVYVGNVVVSEVISVSSTNSLIGNPDYGNGPISYIYNALIPLAEQELGYPALNQSTVVDYASWTYGALGPGCGTLKAYSNGPAYYWLITLQNITTTYSVSPAQLGATLGAIGIDTLEILGVLDETIPYLAPIGILLDLVGLTLPPNTSSSLTLTSLIIKVPINNVNYVAWYLSSINASDVYSIPTFGFIINATNFYQNSNNYLNCNG